MPLRAETDPTSAAAAELRRRERRGWLAVALWSLGIFAVIPLAREIQALVGASVGRSAFGFFVIASVAVGTGAAILSVARRRDALPASRAATVWLLGVAAVFVGYTVALWKNPEEALHFVQYGVLGALLHRVLRCRLRDSGIYLAAGALGAAVGVVDEAIQWLTPRRFWGLRDVWLNFMAGALVQLAIAKGIRPAGIHGPPGPRSVRWLAGSASLTLLLLGVSLLNTPDRMRSYGRLPGLAFVVERGSVMLEYGHLYEDPEIGRFRSRFAPDALRATDASRAAEAASVIDRHRSDEAYAAFLERYTPVSDPFLHEARVHLFRRDRYRALAEERPPGSRAHRERLSVAYRENRILEKYFPETLRRSSYAYAPQERARLEAAQLAEADYESAVSRELVTAVGERGVAAALGLAFLALFALAARYGRSGEAR